MILWIVRALPRNPQLLETSRATGFSAQKVGWTPDSCISCNDAAIVVIDQFGPHFVFHRHVRFAPDAVAKLPLDHAARRFDVRPLMTAGGEFVAIHLKVVVLGP